MTERRPQGQRPQGGAPVGYLNATVAGRRVIVPDPVKAPLVHEADRLWRRGVPLRLILADSRREDWPPEMEGPWASRRYG